jgi:hypothetical protein
MFIFFQVTEQDLIQMGVKVGSRRKLLTALEKYKHSTSRGTAAASAALRLPCAQYQE